LSAAGENFWATSRRYWLKIKALRVLGLEKFLEPGKVWSHDSPEVVEILRAVQEKGDRNLIRASRQDEADAVAESIAELNWLQAYLPQNIKRNGVVHREYSFIDELSTPANWDELAALTAKKQAKKIAELKEAELLAAQALEAVTSSCF
jgi:hypothetical protein